MPDLGVVGEADDLLDQLLAAVVGRVRLAGDDQLDRPLGVQQQRLEPLGVAQHQRQPLVRRHAAREADRQHVGVERGVDPAELGRGGAALRARTCASRWRASSTSRSRSSRLIAQMLGAGDLVDGAARTPRRRRSRGRRRDALRPARRPRGPPRSGACTPLVIEPIGTSASSKAGHRPPNISRLTWPCSCETPLARWASRKPITAMLKTPGRRRRSPRRRARGSARPGRRAWRRSPPKYCSTRSRGNRSMPAGTGRVRGEHRAGAGDLERGVEVEPGPPSATVSSRIRSRPRKPAWPSLVWNTSGAGCAGDPGVGAQRADAADAEQHLLAQPVLAVAAVQPVGDRRGSASGFSSTSESSSSSGTRPTLGDPDPGARRSAAARQRDRDRRALRRRPRAAARAAARRGRGPGRSPAASPRGRATA